MDTAASLVRHIGPCPDALDWLGLYPATPDGQYTAWRGCARGDWMLWLAAKVDIDPRLIALAACDCAETALPYVPGGDERPMRAIETARAWARGDASTYETRAAAAYAHDAYDAADAAPAAYAANAAANAADYAAYYAAYYATAAAHAAAYAASAAYAATAYAAVARADAHTKCAQLVRRRIPWRLIRDGIRETLKEAA